jgi:ATP-dependent DNA helicase PIF1
MHCFTDLHIGDDELKNLCLIEIERLLRLNGRTLRQYECLPFPDMTDNAVFENSFIVDELNYNRDEMKSKLHSFLQLMTDEQKKVYDTIMGSVMADKGGFFFLYGYGGTGKTFLWNTLSAAIRSQGSIVLNVASSGIASLLLPGGRTAHSRFCVPLNATETSSCSIKQGSLRANLLLQTKLIIWDEAPMMHRFCFEALDRTMRDLMTVQDPQSLDKPFGGKVVVLGGDFRQILPVIAKGSKQDITRAAINASNLWRHCRVLRLTTNMRLSVAMSQYQAAEIKEFAEWILHIGDGYYESNESGEADIEIPADLLIQQSPDPIMELVNFAYPNMLSRLFDFKLFEE